MTAPRAATLAANDATYVVRDADDCDAVAAVFTGDAVLVEAGRPGDTSFTDRAALRVA